MRRRGRLSHLRHQCWLEHQHVLQHRHGHRLRPQLRPRLRPSSGSGCICTCGWPQWLHAVAIMQLSSPQTPAVIQQRRTTDDASLVSVLLEREERMQAKADMMREEMEAKAAMLQQEMQAQMEAKVKEIEQKLTPTEAISEQRLAALQVRIEALHANKLLSDDELYALEDMVADFVEFEASLVGVVVLDGMRRNENATKLLTLISLSERITADSAFARQARRKYV